MIQRVPIKPSSANPAFKRQLSSVNQVGGAGGLTENEVFDREDGIGDDDL